MVRNKISSFLFVPFESILRRRSIHKGRVPLLLKVRPNPHDAKRENFEEIGRTYLPELATGYEDVLLLRATPVVSVTMGSVAGLPAVWAPMAHFNVMVKGISQLFPGGPPVVKAALGY